MGGSLRLNARRDRAVHSSADSPAGLACDDVLPGNNGRFALEVADGTGRVAQGGRGEIKIDVRGLATVYSGHLSARGFQTGGNVDGPIEALNAAAAIFAGPAPWMPDMFEPDISCIEELSENAGDRAQMSARLGGMVRGFSVEERAAGD